MSRELSPGALRTKAEASAEGCDLVLQSCILDFSKHLREADGDELVTGDVVDDSRFVPGERKLERQLNAREEFSLPARIEGVVGKDVLKDVAEGGADSVETVRGARDTRVGKAEVSDMGFSLFSG